MIFSENRFPPRIEVRGRLFRDHAPGLAVRHVVDVISRAAARRAKMQEAPRPPAADVDRMAAIAARSFASKCSTGRPLTTGRKPSRQAMPVRYSTAGLRARRPSGAQCWASQADAQVLSWWRGGQCRRSLAEGCEQVHSSHSCQLMELAGEVLISGISDLVSICGSRRRTFI